MTGSATEADQLAASLQLLQQRWATAKATWRDDGAGVFERAFIEPLHEETVRAMETLAALSALLQRAEKSVP